jgi:GT2 family glycosyltransferase
VNLFGMITTSGSRDYTPLALRSFFSRTPLGTSDRLILIDNDADFVVPDDVPRQRLTVVRPERPQGFAVNANMLLAEARQCEADLFLLNNDLVFTSGWLTPFLKDRRSLLSPLSNAQVNHSHRGLTTRTVMNLDDYIGREADLETIARRHRAVNSGFITVGSLAFFCIKIPKSVYDVVGDFDERFGKGGAEDRDYSVRAWIAGIPLEYARSAFVLHFQGRSTWRGPETDAERVRRDAQYIEAFGKKWGPALTHAFINDGWDLMRSDARLGPLIARGEFSAVVRHLRSRPALEQFVAVHQGA